MNDQDPGTRVDVVSPTRSRRGGAASLPMSLMDSEEPNPGERPAGSIRGFGAGESKDKEQVVLRIIERLRKDS